MSFGEIQGKDLSTFGEDTPDFQAFLSDLHGLSFLTSDDVTQIKKIIQTLGSNRRLLDVSTSIQSSLGARGAWTHQQVEAIEEVLKKNKDGKGLQLWEGPLEPLS